MNWHGLGNTLEPYRSWRRSVGDRQTTEAVAKEGGQTSVQIRDGVRLEPRQSFLVETGFHFRSEIQMFHKTKVGSGKAPDGEHLGGKGYHR